jgi:rhodanese-related sulfurtransferase
MRSRPAALVLLLLFLSLCSACSASSQFRNVKAEELKQLIDEGARLMIVDNRSEYEYGQGRIPKAILITQEKFHLIDTLLPPEKDLPVIFYCRGYG